jgi:glycosyltransferase involved in cell wall biosynthesis
MIKCGIYKSKVLKKKIKELDTDVIISSRIEFSKLIDRRDTLNISQEHSYVTTNKYIGRVKKWFKNIDSIVVMTKKAKEDYEKWLINSNSQAKVYNISNMIEKVVDGVNANYDNNTIISVGRLERVKDFPTLLEVFKKVHDSHEELELKIVGEGSQRETLERRIKELNLEGSVTITGRIPTDMVKRELEKAKIFVLTSVCESFSLVLCEAMEQGLPSLSFDIDVGPKEIIKDGYNGFLIENRNVDKMAQKIIELVENRELWNDISKNALEDVSKYYSENVAQGWISILDRK